MTTVAYSLSHAFLAPSFSRRGSRPVRRARRAPPCPPPRGFGFENEELTSAEDDVRTDVAVGISGHTRTGGEDVMDEARVIDPYGLIQDVMSSPALTLTPGLELDDPVVRQSLERYHGLPVVSAETGAAVGVLSRSDVRRLGDENTEAYTVGEAMSSPPVCVRPRAHIAEAAGMMLQHKVHRLPVVDDRNVPIGVATRQDVFEPLVAKETTSWWTSKREGTTRTSRKKKKKKMRKMKEEGFSWTILVATPRRSARAACVWRRNRSRARTHIAETRR